MVGKTTRCADLSLVEGHRQFLEERTAVLCPLLIPGFLLRLLLDYEDGRSTFLQNVG
jgi:hypothetical protein